MHVHCRSRAACACALAIVASSWAADNYWKNASPDGYWTDVAQWTLGLPTQEQTILMNPSAGKDLVIRFPAGVTTIASNSFFKSNFAWWDNSAVGSVTLDATGARMHTQAYGGNSTRLSFMTDNGHYFNREGNATNEVFGLDDAVFTMRRDHNNLSIVVTGDTLEMRNPAKSSANDPDPVMPGFLAVDSMSVDNFTLAFSNSFSRLPYTQFRAAATGENRLVFSGGRHAFISQGNADGNDNAPLQLHNAASRKMTMEIVDGAHVFVTNGMNVLAGNDTVPERTTDIVIDGAGSTFELIGNSTAQNSYYKNRGQFHADSTGRVTVVVQNGGKASFNTFINLLLGLNADKTASKGDVAFIAREGGTLQWNAHGCELTLGGYLGDRCRFPTFAATNGTIRLDSSIFNVVHGGIYLKDSVLCCDSTFWLGRDNSYTTGYRSVLEMDGGTAYLKNLIAGVSGPGAEAHFSNDAVVNVTNGFTVEGSALSSRAILSSGARVRAGSDSKVSGCGTGAELILQDEGTVFEGGLLGNAIGLCLGTSAAQTGTVTVTGGRLGSSESDKAVSLQVGQANNAHGILNVTGGEVIASQINVGRGGSATFRVSGGSVTSVNNINVGYAETVTADTEYRIEQTGGTIVTPFVNVLDCTVNTQYRTAYVTLDGGTFRTTALRGWNGCKAGLSTSEGKAYLFANGGTVVETKTGSYQWPLVYQFTAAKLGPRGLTVQTDQSFTVLRQDFSDQDGVKGRLVKTGSGTAEITSTASTQSYLDVAEGTVTFDTAVTSYPATVTVTNGATLAFENASSGITLGGLSLGDGATAGTLKLSLNDRLHVTGPFAMTNLHLVLTGTHTAGTYPVITVPGDATSGESANRWAATWVYAGRTDGFAYPLTVTYDGETDRTSFNVVAAAGRRPEDAELTHYAADASVSGTTAAYGLSLDAADGVALDGAGPFRFSDVGTPWIKVAGGDNTIATAIEAPSVYEVTVPSGATLDLAGKLAYGGIKKTGDGLLRLTGSENAFTYGFESAGGIFEIPSLAAIASTAFAVQPFKLVTGELRFTSSEEGNLPYVLTIASGTAKPAVVSVAGRISAPMATEGGDLYKRGAGELTATIDEETYFAVKNSGDLGRATNQATPVSEIVTNGTDGVTPVSGYAGLNVAEGTLAFKGSGRSVKAQIPTQAAIGLNETNAPTGNATIRFEDVTARFGWEAPYGHTFIGCNIVPDAVMTNLAFVATNATIDMNTLSVFRGTKKPGMTMTFACDNAEVFGGAHNLGDTGNDTRMVRNVIRGRFDNGSRLVARAGFGIAREVDLVFDHGSAMGHTSAAGEKLVPGTPDLSSICLTAGSGTLSFLNGSTFCEQYLSNGMDGEFRLRFHFDGGIWDAGDADVDLCFQRTHLLTIEAAGEGLVWNVPADRTWTMHAPVTGAGGVVKRGAGTFVFGRGEEYDRQMTAEWRRDLTDTKTFRCTGTTKVEAGTLRLGNGYATNAVAGLDVSAGAFLDLGGNTMNPETVSGAGTISNGVLSAARVLVDYDGGEVATCLAFDSVTLQGLKFDLGLTEETKLEKPYPTGLVVGCVSGTTSVRGCRLAGTGETATRGQFRIADGRLVMDVVSKSGLTILVR